jgi:CheY-like chemotaxis protein
MADQSTPSDPDGADGSGRTGARPRVLLADDYAALLVALRRLLAPSCDVVACVADGVAVIEETARLRPDVVVLDVNLPKVNGLEACRRIRQAMPGIKVVLITAADDAAIRERAFELGASAFVLKYRVADELPSVIAEMVLNS